VSKIKPKAMIKRFTKSTFLMKNKTQFSLFLDGLRLLIYFFLSSFIIVTVIITATHLSPSTGSVLPVCSTPPHTTHRQTCCQTIRRRCRFVLPKRCRYCLWQGVIVFGNSMEMFKSLRNRNLKIKPNWFG
jgi:hypothetical protein